MITKYTHILNVWKYAVAFSSFHRNNSNFEKFYQSLDKRRSAPGAAEPENLAIKGAAFSWVAFNELIAIRIFFRAPKAVIPSSVRFSGVSEANRSMSISFTTNVPGERYKNKYLFSKEIQCTYLCNGQGLSES